MPRQGAAMTARRPHATDPVACPEVAAALPPNAAVLMTPTAQLTARLSFAEWGSRRTVVMVGRSSVVQELHRKVEKVAPFDAPVLITGESGSGKESLAQAIYLLSQRRGKPYLAVNCPQFQEGNLTVSELFGHRKGSFTGATADRKGCFELADQGVLFLDEVADLHPSAQMMLLRALAFGEFQPLGAETTRAANVRVVAASNRTLEELRGEANFREDLFFRLRYFHIHVPALRERDEDWALLTEYFLHRLEAQYGIAKRFSPPSWQILEGYKWPGNVRELASLVTFAYAMSEKDVIEPKDFSSMLETRSTAPSDSPDQLLRDLMNGTVDFWDGVHRRFLARDLNRAQMREMVRRGLQRSANSYRRLLDLFHMPRSDYQRFMDFLRHHHLKP